MIIDITRLRVPAVLVAAAGSIAGAAIAVSANNHTSVDTDASGAWMANDAVTSVSHVGPGGTDATIAVEPLTGDLQVIELDGVAYVMDEEGRLSRIDPATLEVSDEAMLPSANTELVAGADRLYAVDRDDGTVRQLDPNALTTVGTPVDAGSTLGDAVVDTDGVLWVLDTDAGDAIAVDGDAIVTTTETVTAPGVDARLSLVETSVVVSDPVAAQVTVISGRGDGSEHEVPISDDGTLRAPKVVERGHRLPLVDGSGSLVTIDVQSGEVVETDLEVADHELGTPEISSDRVYVPDYTTGSLLVIELDSGDAAESITVTGREGAFDVVVKGDRVYVSDPDSEKAWVIDPDGGVTEVDKYDPDEQGEGGDGQADATPKPNIPEAPEIPRTPTNPPPSPSPSDPSSDGPRTDPGQSTEPDASVPPVVTLPNPTSPPPGNNGGSGNGNGGENGTPPGSGSNGSNRGNESGNGNGNENRDDDDSGGNEPELGDGSVIGLVATPDAGAVTARWRAPKQWGAVTGYSVVVEPGGTAEQVGPGVTSYAVDDADPGTAYRFTVTAIGAGGRRGTPQTTDWVTPIVEGDCAVSNVVATAGNATASVEWQRPHGWYTVTGYRVKLDPAGIDKEVGADETSYTATGLDNDVSHQFTITALSAEETCDRPETSNPVTPTEVIPNPPTNVQATAGDRKVDVTWTPADGPDGADIAGYKIDILRDDGSLETSLPIDGADASSETVPGLTNGSTYRVNVHTVTGGEAISAEPGVSNEFVPSGPPIAPTSVTAAPTARGEATVNWEPAGANGSQITHYVITAQGVDSERVPGNQLRTVMTGLDDGASYTFRVTAHNSNGSRVRDADEITMGTYTPHAPPNFAATPGNGQVTLTWGEPNDNGSGGIKHYIVHSLTDGQSVTATTRSHTFTGLANGTQHTFEIRAVGNNGNDGAKSTATATPVADPPDTPPNLTATPGNGQINLAWNRPNDNGSGIAHYEVRNTTSGQGNGSPTTTSHLVTGLTNGTAYTFEVWAVGTNGTPGATSTVSAAPVANPPDEPTGVNADESGAPGAGEATITWNAPYDGGSPIVEYKVKVVDDNNRGIATTSSTSYTWTGLNPGSSYQFTVWAVNNAGESTRAESNWVAMSEQPTPPGDVTNLNVYVGRTGNRCEPHFPPSASWTAAPDATSYLVDWGTGGGQQEVTGTSASGPTVVGTHTFSITPVNEHGQGNTQTQQYTVVQDRPIPPDTYCP